MLLKSEIKKIIKPLEDLGIPYYINSGLAMRLYGLNGETNDCDIRVFYRDVKNLLPIFKKSAQKIKLRSIKKHRTGAYLSDCLEITNRNKFDVYSQMKFQCDFGKFLFPFDKEIFADVKMIGYQGLKLPTASLETLLLYYLILRRGREDGKNDKKRIIDLAATKIFNLKKFIKLINRTSCPKHIWKLFIEHTNKTK